MSDTAHGRILWTAFAAALLPFGACGGAGEIPAVVPQVEHGDAPVGRSPQFPSQIELELCDRRVPTPRC